MSLHWNLSNSPPGLDDHNMMTQMMMTTFLYTYIGPEERMQKQRKDNISSPAVRDNIKMAPTSSPRLSWTRRQVSAPAPAERREAARVPQEAAATRARRTSGRLPLPPHELCTRRELHRPRRPLKKYIATYLLQSRREPENKVKIKSCKLSEASILAARAAQCRLMCSDCRTQRRT